MDSTETDRRLSAITTRWTELFRAHRAQDEARREAQRRVLERYGQAVYRYLLGAVRDPDAANELYQEFALRFVRGDLRAAAPEHGRFRAFLKTVLANLVADHRRKRRLVPLPDEVPDAATEEATPPEAEREYRSAWRASLLAAAWEALADHERRTGQPLHAVLRLRTDRPDASAQELAEELAGREGRRLTAAWVYKRLHLARAKFADLLLGEVARSLAEPSSPELEEELIELGLLDYCRPALVRRSDRRR